MSAFHKITQNQEIPVAESRKHLAELFDEHHTKNSTMLLAVLSEDGKLELRMRRMNEMVMALVMDAILQSQPLAGVVLQKLMEARLQK